MMMMMIATTTLIVVEMAGIAENFYYECLAYKLSY